MDVEAVAKRIAELISPESPEYKAAAAKRYHDKGIEKGWLCSDLADSLEPLLAEQPEFVPHPTRMIRCGCSASRLTAEEAAIKLMIDAIDGHPIEAAIRDLLDVLQMTEAAGHIFLTLWGVQIRTSVTLPNGTVCMPFSELPNSPTKQLIEKELNRSDFFTQFMLPKLSVPTVALARPFKTSPLFAEASELPSTWEQYFAIESELYETALALTAIGPSAPLHAMSWYSFDDLRLQRVGIGSTLGSRSIEIFPRAGSVNVMLDPAEVLDAVPRILALSGKHRAKINTALTRLNQSMRRLQTADQALDLAIAFESLLVDHSGENTFKVHTRTGLIFPGIESQKFRARAVAHALYELRSQAAHEGKCSNEQKVRGFGWKKSAEVVGEATEICAVLIREIAMRGGLPEWKLCDLDSTKGWPNGPRQAGEHVIEVTTGTNQSEEMEMSEPVAQTRREDPAKPADLVALNNHYDMLQGRIFAAMLTANGILLGFGINAVSDKFSLAIAYAGTLFTVASMYLAGSFRVIRSRVIDVMERRNAELHSLLTNETELKQWPVTTGMNFLILIAWAFVTLDHVKDTRFVVYMVAWSIAALFILALYIWKQPAARKKSGTQTGST